jgi:hypothetical protein
VTEVKRGHTEEELFPGGRMVMTHYRGVFDPGFMKTFYVVLPGDPRPQFVSGSQEETRLKLAVATGLSAEAAPSAYRRDGVTGPVPDLYWRVL